MNDNDRRIEEILSRFGEDFASNTWVVPGGKARAIYHKCIERMVASAKITFRMPTMVSAAQDNVVLIVEGELGDLYAWSFGEASPKNNKNAYPYSMAEKRGKDRVALKLIGLHGLVYSEEEADEFKKGKPQIEDERTSSEIMADELIAEIEKIDPVKLPRLRTHPGFTRDYDLLDDYDKTRVDGAIEARKVAA